MIDLKNPTIVLANGEFPKHQSALDCLNLGYDIICTDGSADKLEEHGLLPKIIIGDFDSSKIKHKKSEVLWIERTDQNKTDLEKTFEWCLSKNIKKIILLGAGGIREDHMLGNLFIVSKFSDLFKIEIVTNYSTIFCIKGSKTIETKIGQQISIIAAENIDRITTTGLKYSLTNEPLTPSSKAISNEAIGEKFFIECTNKVFLFLNHID
tara:strand:+ start:736 stop:1362 length:627 start_codon:yes stop_codon:yes gene_type:complete